jgi:hypothetical protein
MTGELELMFKAGLIGCLQQSGSQASLDGDGRADD